MFFLMPILEKAFSFEIHEDDKETVVNLCKISASKSSPILQTCYVFATKQEKGKERERERWEGKGKGKKR